MKKNFLGKFMVLAAMIYAGFTLSSCDEKDNPSGNNWTALKVTNKTETGATVTANSASEVNSLIASLSKDIKAAVTDGKDYTITIDVPSLKVTETNHTISLPAPNSGEDGGTLILYIKNSFSTDGTPLLVKSNEASEDDWATNKSDSKAEIKLPAGISDIDLEINMPHTTVTLDSKGSATIDNLKSKTAKSTLIIESGITINWLAEENYADQDGRILVKDGAKINGYLRPTQISNSNVETEGVQPLYLSVYKDEEGWLYVPRVYYLDGKDEKAYCTQKLKVVEGEEKFSWINVYNGLSKNDVEIYIEDCGVKISAGNVEKDGVLYPAKIKFVKGEGKAKLYANGRYENWVNGVQMWMAGIDLSAIKELSDVTVDLTMVPEIYWIGGEKKYVEEEIDASDVSLAIQNTDCTFKASKIRFFNKNESANSVTANNCKFEKFGEESAILTDIVSFVTDKTSFNFIFDGCEFKDKIYLYSYIDQYASPWFDKDGNEIWEAYYWLPLDKDGKIINYDWVKASPDVADVPDANVANGEWNFLGGGYEPRWYAGEPIYFKNEYTANITFNNTKANGKAITKDTDFIRNISKGVNSKGEYCTSTFIIIDEKTYVPTFDEKKDKWTLVEKK